jgi:hypothetical protein
VNASSIYDTRQTGSIWTGNRYSLVWFSTFLP